MAAVVQVAAKVGIKRSAHYRSTFATSTTNNIYRYVKYLGIFSCAAMCAYTVAP